jgi:peptidoglycan/xylan/chitin deacetylase (PgdA/CDA1 family)
MSSGTKRDQILCYLAQKDYQVAPITVDSKDFVFNQRLLATPELQRRTYLEELKPLYLDFIWQQTVNAEAHNQYHHQADQAQILLIHANLLNAYVLPDIIKLYKDKGYTFVPLESALSTFKQPYLCANPKNPKLKINKKVESEAQIAMNEDHDADFEDFADWD